MPSLDEEIANVRAELESLREEMPETPLDAERKAMNIDVLEERLAELLSAKDGVEDVSPAPVSNELTEEIASITDELMKIEIKMLNAEIREDDSEIVKLKLSASALRSRRDSLVAEMKASRKAPVNQDLSQRVEALERENILLKERIARLESIIARLQR